MRWILLACFFLEGCIGGPKTADENCEKLSGNVVFVDGANTKPGDGSSWESSFSSIQEAVDAINAKRTKEEEPFKIIVAKGTYKPKANGPMVKLTTRNISILGGFRPGAICLDQRGLSDSILDGSSVESQAIDATFKDKPGQGIIIDGFVIKNFSSGFGKYHGGAVTCENCGGTFSNILFENNRAYSNGGAATIEGEGEVRFIKCAFMSNMAGSGGEGVGSSYGGALFISNKPDRNLTITISDSVFGNASALGLVKDKDGDEKGNHSRGNGGAIYMFNVADKTRKLGTTKVEIIDSQFYGNYTWSSGGAIFNMDATLNIKSTAPGRTIFKWNKADAENDDRSKGQGSAIFNATRMQAPEYSADKNTVFEENAIHDQFEAVGPTGQQGVAQGESK